MTYLERIDTLAPELIESFRRTGNSAAIPAELQQYILELDGAARILRHEGNLTRATQKLRIEFPELTFPSAKNRIYDALTFFHSLDYTVSESIWESYYADRYEDLFKLCVASGKEEAARRNLDRAYELRSRSASAINPGDIKPPVFIIEKDLKPSDLGYDSRKMYEIARKDEAGEYVRLIAGLPTVDAEKKRLLKDSDIQDVEFTEDNDNVTP